MESPQKKRKMSSQESQVPNASSTPQRSSQNGLEPPSMSGIEFSNSSFNLTTSEPIARKALTFPTGKENIERSGRTSISELLESTNTSNSLADITIQEDGEEGLDYDEFFTVTCKRIVLKGLVWNLYKPISEDKGSLYYQITNNPREASVLGKWCAHYFSTKTVEMGTYVLCRLYFDCSGYQKFDLKKYFTYPPDFDVLFNRLNDDKFTDKLLTSKKFLFADNARLAKILKFGIFNFLEKFILEAHEEGVLYNQIFSGFFKLLTSMCEKALFRPLVYTAFVFVIKILTSICMVKEKLADHQRHDAPNTLLDNYINVLYICFTKVCRLTDKEVSTLKIVCINELNIWIGYSANVFVDHYNCTVVLSQLLLDESTSVRMAALELCMKIIQNEKLVKYLKAGPIENLTKCVWGRVCDINLMVGLKAMEVFTALIEYYLDNIYKRNIFDNLLETIYHKDFRMGTAAGKCVVEILTREKNEMKILLYICNIAKKVHPNLKQILVESCIDHTNLLENWPLIINVLSNSNDQDIPIEQNTALSELFLESVHVALTGKFTKVRAFSIKERSVHSASNALIANAIYPNLKKMMVLYRKNDVIVQSLFKILVKIAPEYLTKDHCEVADEIIQRFLMFFNMWNNSETLNAFLAYLLYINENVPFVSTTSKNAIEDLKKYVSEELYKSFKSKDNQTLIMAKKTSLVFNKIDLNEHIEWTRLVLSWNIIELNAEFVEDILAACHWSIIWKIKKLSTAIYSKPELVKEILLISKMSEQLFSTCQEVMILEEKKLKLMAFERICETIIGVCFELENISKQDTALETLKPTLQTNDVLRTQIMNVFELSADPSVSSNASRFRKYIIYIYRLASLEILPMDCLSTILKFYDVYYDHYGKLIEAILVAVREKNKNWIPQLLVNTISLLHENLLAKHGVVDVRSQEAKVVLSLSRRFHGLRKIMSPKIASTLLLYAVNYAIDRKLYDFLIYVRVFTDDVLHDSSDCKEILKRIQEKVPESARKNDSILYFVEHLRRPVAASVEKSVEVVKRARGKRVMAPKLKTQDPKMKGKRLFKNTPSQTSTESDATDKMSIHDTSSDDPEFTNLNNSVQT